MEWRRCQKLRPYFGDAVQLVRQSKQGNGPSYPQDPDKMEFVYFRIIDQNIAPDNDVYILLTQLYARIKKVSFFDLCWLPLIDSHALVAPLSFPLNLLHYRRVRFYTCTVGAVMVGPALWLLVSWPCARGSRLSRHWTVRRCTTMCGWRSLSIRARWTLHRGRRSANRSSAWSIDGAKSTAPAAWRRI
jgi:hypothetical protein